MLEDTDGDGLCDKLTLSRRAERGSMARSAWRLTNTTGSDVADQRGLIVREFDFTGDAADIRGPFLHPDGRLCCCHGRKGRGHFV